jgi:diguanylate cyclase (GGDEF)-like protein
MDFHAIAQTHASMHQADSRDSALLRAALDAVSDPIFLVDANFVGASALNRAAAIFAEQRNHREQTISLELLFPDLNLPARVQAESIGEQREFSSLPITTTVDGEHYELHRITLDQQPQHILIVRSTTESSVADDLSRRDALDDAFHDPLTRLANRRLFESRLRRAIDRAERSQYHFAVLFVDLDRFKQVNDRFGHLQGDRVLVAAAHRLVEAVRPQDMVARRDGDEFTILLDDLDRPEDAVQIAQRIVERIQMPLVDMNLDSTQISIGVSIGIAMASDGTQTAEDLISKADSAMYHAKALGGSTYVNLDHSIQHPR